MIYQAKKTDNVQLVIYWIQLAALAETYIAEANHPPPFLCKDPFTLISECDELNASQPFRNAISSNMQLIVATRTLICGISMSENNSVNHNQILAYKF